jgi:hypothetical protein
MKTVAFRYIPAALLLIALIWALSQFGDMAYLDFVR